MSATVLAAHEAATTATQDDGPEPERVYEACWCSETPDGTSYYVWVRLRTTNGDAVDRQTYRLSKPAYGNAADCKKRLVELRTSKTNRIVCLESEKDPEVEFNSVKSFFDDKILKAASDGEKRRFVALLDKMIASRRFNRFEAESAATPDYNLEREARKAKLEKGRAALAAYDQETRRLEARRSVIYTAIAKAEE